MIVLCHQSGLGWELWERVAVTESLWFRLVTVSFIVILCVFVSLGLGRELWERVGVTEPQHPHVKRGDAAAENHHPQETRICGQTTQVITRQCTTIEYPYWNVYLRLIGISCWVGCASNSLRPFCFNSNLGHRYHRDHCCIILLVYHASVVSQVAAFAYWWWVLAMKYLWWVISASQSRIMLWCADMQYTECQYLHLDISWRAIYAFCTFCCVAIVKLMI